jgi:hypothetical protein
MSKEEAKLIYNDLLKMGVLFELYPDMTGDWSQDSKTFIRDHNLNQDILSGISDEDDFEDDYFIDYGMDF